MGETPGKLGVGGFKGRGSDGQVCAGTWPCESNDRVRKVCIGVCIGVNSDVEHCSLDP